MTEYGPGDLTTRLCRGPGCENELTGADPTRGRYANLCPRCRKKTGAKIVEAREDRHRKAKPGSRLTEADMTLLLAIADGQFPIEIAAEHDVTRTAIVHHLKTVRKKLGARTDAHMVALAYHHGVLQAPKQRR